MSRIVMWPWRSVAAAVLVMYSLCVAASCYGREDPCHALPGIPLQPLEMAGATDCGAASVKPSPVRSSGRRPEFGFTPRILRRLGEQEEERNGSEGGTAGMRLSMSRRSSHPSESSNSGLHSAESLQRSLERDFRRVDGFAERMLSAAPREASSSSSSSRSNFRASFPDLTQPGGKKKQQADDDPSAVNSSTGLYKFESLVESGVPFGSGEYFMDLYVGTPPRHFSVIIDTGSDLTWVQCDPCQLCYHQKGPVFHPSNSSTYEGLTCDSENCASAGGFGDDPANCQKTSKGPGVCKYFYYYGDLSNTTGDYAFETVTFHVSRGEPLQIEQILFGCGHSNIGLFQGAGGLLGLGQGPISFVSQVGNLFGDKFSYCLVDRDDPFFIGSPLIFGEDEVYAKLQAKTQWTPFLEHTPIDTFYYVNITGVSVGGELLKIPETAWQIDMDGYGGTIFDSGTTLSYFRHDAYEAIKKAFVDRISYPMVTSVPVLSVCYNITGIQRPDFPSLSITFKDDAVMDLPFKNYFIRPDPNENVYCLALLGMPSKSLNIIGNFQQQNFHVVYDRGNVRLGFAPVDCTGIL